MILIDGINKLRNSKADKKGTKRGVEAQKGMYECCSHCQKLYDVGQSIELAHTCPHCHALFSMNAFQRIAFVTDSFLAFETQMETINPIGFEGYSDKIKHLQEKTKLDDAILSGVGKIGDFEAVVLAMDTRFLMGSMGTVLGEQVCYAFEQATERNLPVIIFSASGGARMQEGMFSLMQMAKTSLAVARHDAKGLLFINVLCHPTTGGVSASFAFQADIILAEEKALIGFAGKRVIEQTINQKLPDNFQSAEFQEGVGQVDRVIKRSTLKETLTNLLMIHKVGEKNG